MNCTLKRRKGQVLERLNDLSIDLSPRRRLAALHTLVDLSDLLTFVARSVGKLRDTANLTVYSENAENARFWGC